MLFYKGINPRYHIIIANGNTAVILDIRILHITILIDNQLLCESVPIHVVIVAHIIL